MRKVFLASLMAASLTGFISSHAQTITNTNERQKRKIMKKINRSSGIQIFADNSLGSPLSIQEATVKEIAEDDYRVLAGEAPKYVRHTTFPEVTLFNGTGKTITSFAVAVQSAADKPNSGYILLKNNLSVPPSSVYKIFSSEWPKAEKVTIQMAGKFVNRLQQPGLDSAKSWIPGSASDLKVTVGFVEFEDGTKWMISSDSGL